MPTLKPDKDKFLMESYRPLNILHPVDKLYQEHVKNNLYSFTMENNIILPFHHGGLKNHGTDTALATILDNLYKQKENDKITCILQTDLSSAYDTIDHSILLKKLDFYGVRGKSLEIIRNYLCDRKQFVVLDTFKSKILPSLQCSVIQGSKLSSLLYILYTNEIPLLSKFRMSYF